jgi:hypothetical protein
MQSGVFGLPTTSPNAVNPIDQSNDGPNLHARPDSARSCWHSAFIQLGSTGGVAFGAGHLNFANDRQNVRRKPPCRVSNQWARSVIRVIFAAGRPLPVFPGKQTHRAATGMSQK